MPEQRNDSELLAIATTTIRDVYMGYPHQEVVAPSGSMGLGNVLKELVEYQRGRGVDDEGGWDCDLTASIPIGDASPHAALQMPFDIRIDVAAGGGGISSGLLEQFLDDEDPDDPRPRAAADAIESLLLAMACEGVDVGSEKMKRALETAVEAIAQKAFEGSWMPGGAPVSRR